VIFLFYPATSTEKGCFGNSIVFPSLPPTFFPRTPPLPASPSPKPPNLVLRRSGAPHTPPDLPSAPWNPQLPTHHFTGAASMTGLSTAPDLLDLHHGPLHQICFTGALVHHSVGPSLTPLSAATDPPHQKHCSPRRMCFTDDFVHFTGPAPRTPYSTTLAQLYLHHHLIRIFQFVLLWFFLSLLYNSSLTTDRHSWMSTGAATEALEPLHQRRQPAQSQPQHEDH
jgi:hypothetical protein